MSENINRFKLKYETKGVNVYLDGDYLCFLNKNTKDHTKISSKKSKFYQSLLDIGKSDVFTVKLTTALKNQIVDVLNKVKENKLGKKRKVIKPNMDIDSWDKLAEVINRNLYKREADFKFIIASAISLWFHENDFIFVLIVARRGEGKSTILKAFDDSELTYSVDTFTANAFAPGTANIGDERHSLLKECEDKNLIVHDMSASLSLPSEVKLKILGDITNSYDEAGLIKFSPGAGKVYYGGAYNFIGGITYRFLQSNWSLISNTGRFLYYKMPELNFREIVDSNLVPNSKELNAAVKGFLKNLKKQYEANGTIKFHIYPTGIEMMKDFFSIYEKYLQVIWDKDKKELKYDPEYHVENPNRRYRQALMLMKAMAFLNGNTKIRFTDFEHIKQIFWGIDNKIVRRNKLNLLDEFVKLNFIGKSYNHFSLFDVATAEELYELNKEEIREVIKLYKLKGGDFNNE